MSKLDLGKNIIEVIRKPLTAAPETLAVAKNYCSSKGVQCNALLKELREIAGKEPIQTLEDGTKVFAGFYQNKPFRIYESTHASGDGLTILGKSTHVEVEGKGLFSKYNWDHLKKKVLTIFPKNAKPMEGFQLGAHPGQTQLTVDTNSAIPHKLSIEVPDAHIDKSFYLPS